MKIPARDIARDLQRKCGPGCEIAFGAETLSEVETVPGWTPAEWILEQIPGAAYEWRIREFSADRKVVFEHLSAPLTGGLRSYVSPERRHLFNQRADGLFEPKK